MTRYIALVLFALTILLDSCNNKLILDKNEIEFVEIRKQADTVSLRLTTSQVDDFIDVLSNSTSKGLTKYLPEYILTIHVSGDSLITYRTSGDLVKKSNDLTYEIGEADYFRNLWLTQAGLSDNWFEYFPIYMNDDELAEKRGTIDQKHLEAIKKVLTHYNHKWTDIRGQLFYEGRIDNELMWNYTTKANDSTWILDHN